MRWVLVLPAALTASLIMRLSLVLVLSFFEPTLRQIGVHAQDIAQMMESAIASFTFVAAGTLVSPTHKTTVGFILLFITVWFGGMPTHPLISDTSWVTAALFGGSIGILFGVKKSEDEKKLAKMLVEATLQEDLAEKERILQKLRASTNSYESVYHEATLMLASVLRRAGRNEEAIKLVRETFEHINRTNPSAGEHIHPIASELVPLKQKSLCEMARIYRDLGNDVEAETHYKRALTMTANDSALAASLAELLEEANNFSVDRERKEKIKQLQPVLTVVENTAGPRAAQTDEGESETIELRKKITEPAP
jgi:hypothetical protein